MYKHRDTGVTITDDTYKAIKNERIKSKYHKVEKVTKTKEETKEKAK